MAFYREFIAPDRPRARKQGNGGEDYIHEPRPLAAGIHEEDIHEEVLYEDESDRAATIPRREGREWIDDSKYKDSRQPPLGLRLEHVLNFLSEEDIDRYPRWKAELQQVVDYLEWLGKDDPDKQLEKCGLEVRNMYRDAIVKVEVHRQFEKFHYAATPLSFRRTALPRPPSRLGWAGAQRESPICLASQPLDAKLRPRGLLSRPIRPLDIMFAEGEENGERLRAQLFRDEMAFWSEGEDEATSDNNLFLAENAAYEEACRRVGWVSTDHVLGERYLPDGSRVNPDEDISLAQERGARRAGLQQALRSFSGTEHAMTVTPWRRIRLPLEHADLERCRKEADRNLVWEPACMPDHQMLPRPRLETMPYTYWWRQRSKAEAHVREKARQIAMSRHGGTQGWINVPRSAATGGAFVWRGVDPDVEAAQDLLRECETTLKLLAVAHSRTGDKRPLLVMVNALCEGASQGDFGVAGNQFQDDDSIALRGEHWEHGLVGGRVKSITRDGLQWLRFLTTKNANPQILVPLRQTGKLFRIFAKRLERVMSDPNLAPFFSNGGSLTVEDILTIINKGQHGPVRKTEFTVTDAMCWLPKLDEQGRVSFNEDLMCHGTVGLPPQSLYPEDCIRDVQDWDPDLWAPQPEYIEPYKEHLTPRWPDDPAQERVAQFFQGLGFRLGLTLYRLRQEQAHWPALAPISSRVLLDFIAETEAMRAELAKSVGGQVLSLPEVVRTANPADYRDGMTDEEALAVIRAGIIDESASNLTMLARARRHVYRDSAGNLAWTWVRDHSWGWASEAVRGRRPRFWSLDRWPVCFQTERTERRIREDADVDPRMVWDPRAEDSTASTRVRPKLRKYGEREKLKYRPGLAIYPIGDTPLQQRIFKERQIAMVAEALGLDDAPRPRTWGERLSGLLPAFVRPSSPANDPLLEPRLPDIDPSLVPVSWDPEALVEAQQHEGEDEDGVADDNPGDQEMTDAS